jgi:hypothetical protein
MTTTKERAFMIADRLFWIFIENSNPKTINDFIEPDPDNPDGTRNTERGRELFDELECKKFNTNIISRKVRVVGKVKNYLQEKAEDFMHEIEDKVSKGKMTKGCAYKLSVDRKDEIAFDLIGFDSEDIDTQIKMWVDSIEVPWWNKIKDVRF